MNEVCLGVQPFMQPSPARNPGGDCFACALTAALRWIHQRPDIAFDPCWESFLVETSGGGTTLSNSWPGMRSALYASVSKFGQLEILSDIIDLKFEPDTWSHAWFGGVSPSVGYATRLEAWLRAGYVAFSEINFAGGGPVVDGKWNVTDHFVLIDGVRHYWKPHETVQGAASAESDIHVVCSARGAYWIDARDLTFKHGAAGWWLARKDRRRA